MKRILVLLVIIGTWAILGPGVIVNAGEDFMAAAGVTKIKEGISAPTFAIEDVTGRPGRLVKLEDFRGKVVLLNFWATW